MAFATVREAIEDIKAGKFIIIVDDENRENEGDLAIAAEKVNAEAINFMAKHARGLICLPIIGHRLDELKIPLMVQENTAKFSTAFAVSIEAKHKTSSGISAHDRAATVRAVLDSHTKAEDLARPGHMFPIRAKEGGVLVRAGHTEAIVDLAKFAGLYPAGVVCEIMNEDGTMARLPQLEAIADKFGIKIMSIADLIAYRRRHERLIERVAEAKLPTKYGEFVVIAYKSRVDPDEHVALVKGDISGEEPVLVRVHSECLTVMFSAACAVIVAVKSRWRWQRLLPRVAGSFFTCGRKVEELVFIINSALMLFRTRVWILLKPIWHWGSTLI